jgi:hypothetical protein
VRQTAADTTARTLVVTPAREDLQIAHETRLLFRSQYLS